MLVYCRWADRGTGREVTSSRTQGRHDPLKFTSASPLTTTVSLLKFGLHSQLKFKQKGANWEFTHTHTHTHTPPGWSTLGLCSISRRCVGQAGSCWARATFILPLGLPSPSTLLSSLHCPSTLWPQWPHCSLFYFMFLTTAAVRATGFMGSLSLLVSCESQSPTS